MDSKTRSLEEYKTPCSCRNCENAATCCLRIAFINREGDFYEGCAKDLTDKGLVVYSNAIELGIRTGIFKSKDR